MPVNDLMHLDALMQNGEFISKHLILFHMHKLLLIVQACGEQTDSVISIRVQHVRKCRVTWAIFVGD